MRRAAPQPDLDRAVADVERGQIVALHQTNEVVKPLNVEWLGRTGGVLRHSFTPQLANPESATRRSRGRSDRHTDRQDPAHECGGGG